MYYYLPTGVHGQGASYARVQLPLHVYSFYLGTKRFLVHTVETVFSLSLRRCAIPSWPQAGTLESKFSVMITFPARRLANLGFPHHLHYSSFSLRSHSCFPDFFFKDRILSNQLNRRLQTIQRVLSVIIIPTVNCLNYSFLGGLRLVATIRVDADR